VDDSKKEFFRQLLVEEKKNIERTINLMEEHGISKQNVPMSCPAMTITLQNWGHSFFRQSSITL